MPREGGTPRPLRARRAHKPPQSGREEERREGRKTTNNKKGSIKEMKERVRIEGERKKKKR